MSKIFDTDNKLFTVLSKIWDMMVLNFFWFITVLAFIGPACTGLYYAVVKNIRRSRDYAGKSFFHSFKSNFKQAAILGALQIVFGVGLLFCYDFAIHYLDEKAYLAQVYYWLVVIMIILFLMVSIYIYPVLSRFDLKVSTVIKMSFFMAFRHLLTTVIGVLGLAVCFFCITSFIISPLLLIAPVLYTFGISFPMEKVLRKYMPKKEDADPIAQEAWYYE